MGLRFVHERRMQRDEGGGFDAGWSVVDRGAGHGWERMGVGRGLVALGLLWSANGWECVGVADWLLPRGSGRQFLRRRDGPAFVEPLSRHTIGSQRGPRGALREAF